MNVNEDIWPAPGRAACVELSGLFGLARLTYVFILEGTRSGEDAGDNIAGSRNWANLPQGL